ncbi:hypothetical protein PanWU01x14_032030 [Parasponia andersonii]|uniref:Uncharacterized protein n=1 Tax=Parasponia andersonii TaxID=3476 RepID=A0A2P5DUB1_PARAD|nr:hypothetical protein PanWU01x14_032030 [Parasponia andersonii]
MALELAIVTIRQPFPYLGGLPHANPCWLLRCSNVRRIPRLEYGQGVGCDEQTCLAWPRSRTVILHYTDALCVTEKRLLSDVLKGRNWY